MTVTPVCIIGGVDYSRYVEVMHCEMSSDQDTDPGKFDVTLSNINGQFYGAKAIAAVSPDAENGGMSA
jgi:hypothetical protein